MNFVFIISSLISASINTRHAEKLAHKLKEGDIEILKDSNGYYVRLISIVYSDDTARYKFLNTKSIEDITSYPALSFTTEFSKAVTFGELSEVMEYAELCRNVLDKKKKQDNAADNLSVIDTI